MGYDFIRGLIRVDKLLNSVTYTGAFDVAQQKAMTEKQ